MCTPSTGSEINSAHAGGTPHPTKRDVPSLAPLQCTTPPNPTVVSAPQSPTEVPVTGDSSVAVETISPSSIMTDVDTTQTLPLPPDPPAGSGVHHTQFTPRGCPHARGPLVEPVDDRFPLLEDPESPWFNAGYVQAKQAFESLSKKLRKLEESLDMFSLNVEYMKAQNFSQFLNRCTRGPLSDYGEREDGEYENDSYPEGGPHAGCCDASGITFDIEELEAPEVPKVVCENLDNEGGISSGTHNLRDSRIAHMRMETGRAPGDPIFWVYAPVTEPDHHGQNSRVETEGEYSCPCQHGCEAEPAI